MNLDDFNDEFSKLFNLSKLGDTGKLLKMSSDYLEETNRRRKAVTAEGVSGAGLVKVRMNGDFKVTDILIEDDLWAMDDKEAFILLVMSAVNTAIENLNEAMTKEMGSAASAMAGLKL